MEAEDKPRDPVVNELEKGIRKAFQELGKEIDQKFDGLKRDTDDRIRWLKAQQPFDSNLEMMKQGGSDSHASRVTKKTSSPRKTGGKE